MSVILGIDPGSRITGYGVIRQQGNKFHYLGSGCIRTLGNKAEAEVPLAERLRIIHDGVKELITQFQPTVFAIEAVFYARSGDSSLKLGQARGAAIVAAACAGLAVHEYAPRAVKLAVVGTGAADKTQVQHMVAQLLALPAAPQADAADALAIALCHGHAAQSLLAMAGAVKGRRGGRWR